jgi:hypothetical protein
MRENKPVDAKKDGTLAWNERNILLLQQGEKEGNATKGYSINELGHPPFGNYNTIPLPDLPSN